MTITFTLPSLASIGWALLWMGLGAMLVLIVFIWIMKDWRFWQ